MAAASSGTVLHGVGVGRRAAIGPVVRVQPAPAVPPDTVLMVDGRPATPDQVRDAAGAAFTAVAQALTTQSSRATGTVRDVLAATKNFDGVTGVTTINEHRDATKPAVILRVKDGKFKYLETVNP